MSHSSPSNDCYNTSQDIRGDVTRDKDWVNLEGDSCISSAQTSAVVYIRTH